MWNYGSDSPKLTRLTKTADPNGFVNVDILSEPDPVNAYSPFDTIYPWSQMKEVYTLSDATPIDTEKIISDNLDRQNLRQTKDVLIPIPIFYYNVVDDPINKKRYWYILEEYDSDYEAQGFEKHPGSGCLYGKYEACRCFDDSYHNAMSVSGSVSARNIGRDVIINDCSYNGIKNRYLGDYTSYCAVCLLFLIEYATFDASRTLGPGHNVDTGTVLFPGSTDDMVYHTSAASQVTNTVGNLYRGIENLYANFWKWQEGAIAVAGVLYITTDYTKYGTSVDGWESTEITIPYASGHIISKLFFLQKYKWTFFPQEAGGGDKTKYTTDGAWNVLTGNRLIMTGDIYHGESAGIMAFGAYYNVTSGDGQVGYRIMYRDTEKTGIYDKYLTKQ